MRAALLCLFIVVVVGAAPEASAQSRYADMDLGRPTWTSGMLVVPRAPLPPRTSASIDSRMILASRIAEARAERRSVRLCWRYVKNALVKAGVVRSYPRTAYAKQAGEELVTRHGFVRLRVRDPYSAPVGAVLVYGGRGAGHVEIRTSRGFVSDYRSRYACGLPFLGAYVKGS